MTVGHTVGAVGVVAALVTALAAPGAPASADAGPASQAPAAAPVALGYGGAVASVNPYATQAGIEILRRGGNAVDAAVATAAALGVVEPYSAGIGGGGFFVYYDARSHQVHSIDGRETAPARDGENLFIDPSTGKPLPFDQAVNSGLSVGVPGTPATWAQALENWGTTSLDEALRPAIQTAEQGFVVNQNFHAQTQMNAARFRDITPTAQLFLPDGAPPAVGSVFRNPDLAATYRLLGRDGVDAIYQGQLGQEIAQTVQNPPVAPNSDRVFRPGSMQPSDLAAYQALDREPTHSTYHGLDVYGMAPPSSGGTTVGEALNILDNFSLSSADRVQALHHYLEASRIAFADRNRWVGDPAYSDVPVEGLLSQEFGKDRACLISPTSTLTSPVRPGDPNNPSGDCTPGQPGNGAGPYEGLSTTHLVATDRWGNVVAYTLTIEQTGGSAITVPHRGFLLNNELTDFNFTPLYPGVPDPNLPAPGKRPRSSMSPTIVLRDGQPLLAVGTPGGATIITTVLQILLNRLDLGMTLPDAIAAPRASQRNSATTQAEPAFLNSPERAALEKLGQHFVLAPPAFTPAPEIGAATGLEFLGAGKVQAAAEPQRRGGGSAMVVAPASKGTDG
jgi:gamma-glutamyltranspeptidase/glutathione hydrolase